MNNSKSKYNNLIVFADNGANFTSAEALAQRLEIEFTNDKLIADKSALVLKFDNKGLALTGDGQVLRGDFTKMLPRLKNNNLQSEMLVKASKIKGADYQLTAIDATAGFGEDSLLLAAAGFSVKMYEYNPVISALLKDALRRAFEIDGLKDIVSRMELVEEDSVNALKNLSQAPDVILLDPMFPERQKSALVKKKFQLLHHLESPCTNEDDLVRAAVLAKPKKVVIKRPVKGPCLADIKPSYSIGGKAIRYDCIIPATKNFDK